MENQEKTERTKYPAINVLQFYYTVIQLKTLIRNGWKQWNVSVDRLESVAEHVYGVCMLALAMASEYYYEVDLYKVIAMLALHELEEIEIGDITPIDDVTEEEKKKMGHAAIDKLLTCLRRKETYQSLILEFDAQTTDEARFAYMCDKLEADLMSIYYDWDGTCTVDSAPPEFQETLRARVRGNGTMCDEFFYAEEDSDRLDAHFHEVLDQAMYGIHVDANL